MASDTWWPKWEGTEPGRRIQTHGYQDMDAPTNFFFNLERTVSQKKLMTFPVTL